MAMYKLRYRKSLASVLVGNLIYFTFQPQLPPVLRHERFKMDWGLAADAAICLAVYGLIELVGVLLRKRPDSS